VAYANVLPLHFHEKTEENHRKQCQDGRDSTTDPRGYEGVLQHTALSHRSRVPRMNDSITRM
jgi:hypothetical protein